MHCVKVAQRPKIRPFLRRNNSISTTAKPTGPARTATTPRINVRRRYRPTTHTVVDSQGPLTTESSRKEQHRNRFSTRRPTFQATTTTKTQKSTLTTKLNLDQSSESSNQQSLEGGDTAELGDIATALHQVQQAQLRNQTLPTSTVAPFKTRITTTVLPLSTRKVLLRKTHQPIVEKSSPLEAFTRKTIQYDYDDGIAKFIGTLPEHSKVLIHSSGAIQCLDQGSFPHPVSCKKFISCAKMETGNVLGWEYSCPKGLSFDPIGGMCNWSADLGCDE